MLALLPPRAANLDLAPNVIVAVVAALAATVVWPLRHRPLPASVIHALTAFGTALITVVTAFGGDQSTQFAVFYLWMVVYAAVFFTFRGFMGHLALAAAGYVVATGLHHEPAQLIDFAPVVAVPALVVGGFAHVVASRMRDSARRLLACVQISGHLVSENPDDHDVLPTICQGSLGACNAVTATMAARSAAGEWTVVAREGPGSVDAAELAALAQQHRGPWLEQGGGGRWWRATRRRGAGGSRLIHPLRDGDELIGVLAVDWDTIIARVSDVVAHLMRAYAEQATAALRYRHLHSSLTHLAATDALTGLPNRRAFESALSAYGMAGRRRQDDLAVALFDLDGFKEFNDASGHPAGDELLGTIAASWQARIRDEDLLARLGGDEFALIAPHTTLSGAVALAQELCALMPSPEVSCSAGVAMWRGEESLPELLEVVDQYLYTAKRESPGQVRARPDTDPPPSASAVSHPVPAPLSHQAPAAAAQQPAAVADKTRPPPTSGEAKP